MDGTQVVDTGDKTDPKSDPGKGRTLPKWQSLSATYG